VKLATFRIVLPWPSRRLRELTWTVKGAGGGTVAVATGVACWDRAAIDGVNGTLGVSSPETFPLKLCAAVSLTVERTGPDGGAPPPAEPSERLLTARVESSFPVARGLVRSAGGKSVLSCRKGSGKGFLKRSVPVLVVFAAV
jgi:hypothetical protein